MRDAPCDPLQRYLLARLGSGWMPGAVWSVTTRAQRVSGGAVGAAALQPALRPATLSTPYDLASLTKALATAPLLALLEQEGRLDLLQPVVGHVPELRGSPYERATALALATHAAGCPAWAPLYRAGRSLERYLERIAELPPGCEPGRTLYSDLGYVVLGAWLERVSGQTLDRLFHERLAAPLGLDAIGYASPDRPFAQAAATEEGNHYEQALAGGTDVPLRRFIPAGQVHDGNAYGLGGVAGHAGLFGTAENVGCLAHELLIGERLGLGRAARARLTTIPAASAGRTVGWVAAGWSAATRGVLPACALGHVGFTGTSVWVDAETASVFVLLSNRVHPRVPARDFQLVRRGFHRLARRALERQAPAGGQS